MSVASVGLVVWALLIVEIAQGWWWRAGGTPCRKIIMDVADSLSLRYSAPDNL